MNILVTGGAGYIGSATAEALLDAGHRVTVFDNLSLGYRAAIPSRAQFIWGDIGDRLALKDVFEQSASSPFDAVLHFAALALADESMQQPALYFRSNVAHSGNVIEAASAAGCHKFVLSSTAAVYASNNEPLTEASPLGPVNVYGDTKLMVEAMLRWFQKTQGLHYAALRYFNASGALPQHGEAHQPETHLIPRVLQVALGQSENVQVYGDDYPTPDGTCIRDYIHIADLAQAHVLAAEALSDQDALVYNLGTGSGYSNQEIIEMAREVTGHPIPSSAAPRRAGDAAQLVAAPDKIRAELGWDLQHSSVRNILQTSWEWHREHPQGYATA